MMSNIPDDIANQNVKTVIHTVIIAQSHMTKPLYYHKRHQVRVISADELTK